MSTRLKEIREQRGLTTIKVAEDVQINQSYYSKLENGNAKPSPEVAEKIALYFGHGITELELLYPERYPARRVVA